MAFSLTDEQPNASSRFDGKTSLTTAVATIFVGAASTAGELLASALDCVVVSPSQVAAALRAKPVRVVTLDGSVACTTEMADLVRFLKDNGIGAIVAFCPGDRLVQATWVEAGIDALCTNEMTVAEMNEQLGRVARGETVLGVSVREGLLAELRADRSRCVDKKAQFAALTRREADVLRALANGTSPEEVARNSYVSLNTIRTQIRGILAKLGTGSMVGAVGLAYRSGWLEPDATL